MQCADDAAFAEFLAGVLSPDPAVQRHNTAVMNELVASPTGAAVAQFLRVVLDATNGYPASIRQAAVAFLRRLLQDNPHGALNAAGQQFASALPPLLEALWGTGEEGPMQRAMASLIGALLIAAGNPAGAADADSLWCTVFSSMAGRLAQHEPVPPPRTVAGAATLLRILCEDAPQLLGQFLSAEGDHAGRSVALCAVFDRLLTASLPANGTRSSSAPLSSVSSSSVDSFATVLDALAMCFMEGVLPVEHPFSDAVLTRGDDDGGDGPAAQALRELLPHTTALHNRVAAVAVGSILPGVQPRRVQAVFRYMTPMVTVAGRGVEEANGAFLTAAIPAALALWGRDTAPHAGGDGPSVATVGAGEEGEEEEEMEKAINATLDYFATVALLGSSTPTTAPFVAGLPSLLNALLALAVLPTDSISSGRERDTDVPDDPRSVRIVLSGRRRGAPEAASSTDSSGGGGGAMDDEDDGEAHGRRGLISTLLNNISVACDSANALVAYLLPPTLGILRGLADPAQSSPALAEAALFVVGEIVEGCLSAPAIAPLEVGHVAAVVTELVEALNRHHHNNSNNNNSRVVALPYNVRAQAYRFIARASAAAIESLLRCCPSAVAGYVEAVLLPQLLTALASCVGAETNKAAQRQCIEAMSAICCAALRSPPDDLSGDDDDDDDDSDDAVTAAGGGGGGWAPGKKSSGASPTTPQRFSQHLLDTLFSAADDAPVQAVLLSAATTLPRLQLGPRTAWYDLLGTVVPLQSERGVHLHAAAIEATLQVLTQRCSSLLQQLPQQQPPGTCGGGGAAALPDEAAYLLVTVSQVAAAAGAVVAPALPWFSAVSRDMMRLWCAQEQQKHSGCRRLLANPETGVDMDDACELAVDLLSALCDALLDRDQLLPLIAAPGAVADEAAANCHLLRQHFFPSSVPSDDDGSLPWLSLAVLRHCHARRGGSAGVSDGGDDLDSGLRRACLGFLYDAAFAAPSASRAALFWPALEATVVEATRCCSDIATATARIDETASNAFLCLAELLTLACDDDDNNNNSITSGGGGGGDCDGVHRGGYVLTAGAPMQQAGPALEQIAAALSAALSPHGAVSHALPRDVRLNMVSALCAVVAFLVQFQGDFSGNKNNNKDNVGSSTRSVVLSTLQTTAHSLHHFTDFEEDGYYECCRLLAGLRRLFTTLCGGTTASLDDVARLVATQPDVAAKTVATVAKAVTALAAGGAPAAPLARNWAGLAQALSTAPQLSKATRRAVATILSAAS